MFEEEVRNNIQLTLKAKSCSVLRLAGGERGSMQTRLNKQINGDTSISLTTILIFLQQFPDISAEWLLRGEGNMFKLSDSDNKEITNNAYSREGNANAGGTQIIGASQEEISALKKRIAELEQDKQNMQKLIDKLV